MLGSSKTILACTGAGDRVTLQLQTVAGIPVGVSETPNVLRISPRGIQIKAKAAQLLGTASSSRTNADRSRLGSHILFETGASVVPRGLRAARSFEIYKKRSKPAHTLSILRTKHRDTGNQNGNGGGVTRYGSTNTQTVLDFTDVARFFPNTFERHFWRMGRRILRGNGTSMELGRRRAACV